MYCRKKHTSIFKKTSSAVIYMCVVVLHLYNRKVTKEKLTKNGVNRADPKKNMNKWFVHPEPLLKMFGSILTKMPGEASVFASSQVKVWRIALRDFKSLCQKTFLVKNVARQKYKIKKLFKC